MILAEFKHQPEYVSYLFSVSTKSRRRSVSSYISHPAFFSGFFRYLKVEKKKVKLLRPTLRYRIEYRTKFRRTFLQDGDSRVFMVLRVTQHQPVTCYSLSQWHTRYWFFICKSRDYSIIWMKEWSSMSLIRISVSTNWVFIKNFTSWKARVLNTEAFWPYFPTSQGC